jgi:predicted dehydrogenase
VLVEKPLASSEHDAEDLADAAERAGTLLFPGHNDLFHAGLSEFLDAAAGAPLTIVRRLPAGASDVPSIWSRPALYETLYHLVVIAHAHTRGAATPLLTEQVQFSGEAQLSRLRALLSAGTANVELIWEIGGGDELQLRAAVGKRELWWARRGAEVTNDLGAGPTPRNRTGSDAAAMLRAFRDAIASGSSRTRASDGVEVMRATRGLLDALALAGAPLEHADRPKHGSSRALSRRYR